MQPRVAVVLVVRNGANYLPRTLEALAAQTRRPDSIVVVDAGSVDGSPAMLAESGPFMTTAGRRSFGAAVAHAVAAMPPQEGTDEWLWLLAHDNAPEPSALSALLGAVEVAPSVAVAGPKLMQWDQPDLIASYGETLTTYGRSVSVVTGELDQAQHDMHSDLLGVAAGGMLVRRSVWTALGGFDPALPSVDAALDFSVRARLAGHRVVGVPGARVASAGPAELWGRSSLSAASQNRVRRSAQLHRRLVYAPPLAVPFHWLSLLPLAVLRSLAHLVAKRPGWVGGEISSALRAAFDGGVAAARTTIRRTRVMGWAAIAPLRMTGAELRQRRASASGPVVAAPQERVGFFAGGGAWMVLLAGVIGIVAFGRLLDAPAIVGGALAPLSSTAAALWSHVGYAWHDLGAGFVGAADPFTTVLAVLGSLTFWAPSSSIVLLYAAALPLAALTAWWCAARFTTTTWPPAIAALGWALAPPFLASLGAGQLGAVIAHILLPTLVLAIVTAARSWSMAAVAALLFAAVAASAPVLVPALLLGTVVWAVAHPRGLLRVLGIPIPAAALFAPLVVEQFARGNPLALLVTPGVPVITMPGSSLVLSTGAVADDQHGWGSLLAALGLDSAAAPLIVLLLLLPLAALAFLALALPGWQRAIPAMLIALAGYLTAVAGSQLQLVLVESTATSAWAGAALSLYWLGLLGSAILAIEAMRRVVVLPALILAVGLVLVAVPQLGALATGSTAVAESNGRMLPAFASAEAASDPRLGTLELVGQRDGSLAVTIHRGTGTTLDEQSTLAATDTAPSAGEERLAVLAGNIASRSGFDIAAELDDLRVAFVLLSPAEDENARAVALRATEALDGNRLLTRIGDTADGALWHYAGLADGSAPGGPGPLDTTVGVAILVGQAVVFGLTILIAVPNTRRRRVRASQAAAGQPEETRE
jgi:GT2 family glycosyltransferase